MIKPPIDKVCFDNIYKSGRIHFRHLSHQKLGLFPRYHRIQKAVLGSCVAADAFDPRCAVIGKMRDLFINFIRLMGDDK